MLTKPRSQTIDDHELMIIALGCYAFVTVEAPLKSFDILALYKFDYYYYYYQKFLRITERGCKIVMRYMEAPPKFFCDICAEKVTIEISSPQTWGINQISLAAALNL